MALPVSRARQQQNFRFERLRCAAPRLQPTYPSELQRARSGYRMLCAENQGQIFLSPNPSRLISGLCASTPPNSERSVRLYSLGPRDAIAFSHDTFASPRSYKEMLNVESACISKPWDWPRDLAPASNGPRRARLNSSEHCSSNRLASVTRMVCLVRPSFVARIVARRRPKTLLDTLAQCIDGLDFL